MTDLEANSARGHAERKPSSQPDLNHPLPLRAMAHMRPTPTVPQTNGEKAAGYGKERHDPVGQLAEALRTARRSHRAYLAELWQVDVQPAEDWSTWYAEYLLGLR
jgi:hypothetical protein